MKANGNFSKRTNWFKVSMALITCLSFLAFPSCQKDESEQDLLDMEGIVYKAIELSSTADVLYGPETFTIISKAPVVETRTSLNLNCEFYENFVLKVQNGNSGKTKVTKIQIKIDGVPIVSSSDFRKNTNIVSKQLSGLTPETILEIELVGSKGSFITLAIEGTLKENAAKDIDGNYYHAVLVGNKWWMAENLKTTRYNNGDPIEYSCEWNTWGTRTTGLYTWYNCDISHKNPYGALYNFFAVSTGICPVGWHVPSEEEFTTLFSLADAIVNPAGIKATGTIEDGTGLWQSPNIDAANLFNFNALPAGYYWIGYYEFLGRFVAWYTNIGTHYIIWNDGGGYGWGNVNPYSGHSVRCVKD
jgi:uncharacterized protein (TIGR02145 family)